MSSTSFALSAVGVRDSDSSATVAWAIVTSTAMGHSHARWARMPERMGQVAQRVEGQHERAGGQQHRHGERAAVGCRATLAGPQQQRNPFGGRQQHQ
jgi:hypothetical protein